MPKLSDLRKFPEQTAADKANGTDVPGIAKVNQKLEEMLRKVEQH